MRGMSNVRGRDKFSDVELDVLYAILSIYIVAVFYNWGGIWEVLESL